MKVLALLPAIVLAVFPSPARQNQATKFANGLYAEVTTNKGVIVMQLEFEKVPMTVANFVGLAEGTIANSALPVGMPYFDGSKFHRVVPGHVIQTGIPAKGKSQGPGYQFPNEIHLPDLNHDQAGMVNMANSGPHTNGSQWCIMLGDRSYLDGDYTVFGRVVEGMNVVFSIVQGDEIQRVKIIRIGATAEAFHPTTDSFQKLVGEAKARVQQAEERKKAAEEKLIVDHWPQTKLAENGVKYVVVRDGEGAAAGPGARLKVEYSGRTLNDFGFVSTADGGKPYFGETPESFDFEVGKAQVQVGRGFDAMVSQMKKGERRTLIVPAGQAYGIAGFYDRERPGQKRFHISPNTTLVYDVTVLDVVSKQQGTGQRVSRLPDATRSVGY